MPPPKDPIKYEEYRRKLSEALKKRYADPIKGEEYRRKMSETLKKLYEDPIKGEEIRRKISEAGKGERNPFFGKKHSKETRRKISEAHKKRFEDPIKREETRLKMSVAQKLRAPPSEEYRQNMREILKTRYADPIKGEETRRKISEGGKGKKRSEETRRKLSKAVKLRAPPSEETRRKISESWKQRAPPSEETRRKIGDSQRGSHRTGETRRKQSLAQKGEKGSNWMGGISFFPYCPKFNNEFKERVRAFFNYKCAECDEPQKGKALAVHHVNFNKSSCCDPNAPRLFVPLCASCHSKTNYNREYWEPHFTEMINKYYGGKCYFLTEDDRNKTIK